MLPLLPLFVSWLEIQPVYNHVSLGTLNRSDAPKGVSKCHLRRNMKAFGESGQRTLSHPKCQPRLYYETRIRLGTSEVRNVYGRKAWGWVGKRWGDLSGATCSDEENATGQSEHDVVSWGWALGASAPQVCGASPQLHELYLLLLCSLLINSHWSRGSQLKWGFRIEASFPQPGLRPTVTLTK